jgi:hypothetical protein
VHRIATLFHCVIFTTSKSVVYIQQYSSIQADRGGSLLCTLSMVQKMKRWITGVGKSVQSLEFCTQNSLGRRYRADQLELALIIWLAQ